MSQPDWSKAPEGATHYAPETTELHPGFIMMQDGKWMFSREDSAQRSSHKWYPVSGSDSPARWIERPLPQWNGTGLPPVGTACECSWDSGSGTYEKAKVVAHDDGRAVFKWLTGSRPGTYQAADACGLHGGRVPQFRPIRTPEQIAADEREAAIEEMLSYGGMQSGPLSERKTLLGALYDAGYRKQSTKQDDQQ